MLRVHRPDGTPVLIDHGPASARHGKVTFRGDGTSCIAGVIVRGDHGKSDEVVDGPRELANPRSERFVVTPEDRVRERVRLASARYRERHRPEYNAYMRAYQKARRQAGKAA